MSSRFEPDDRFMDRLEWQLTSEFRRKDRMKPPPGRIAVPRSVAALSLAAGILLLGVAATKAADLIKDSWRKKIEVARLETDVKIKTALLDLKKGYAARTENRFSAGLISEEETLDSRRSTAWAAADLERTLLDLEEARRSGEAPRDELYAPLIRGRDFVAERLEIQKQTLEADLALQRSQIERRLKERVDLGLVAKGQLDEFQRSLAAQEGEIEDIGKRLALRRRFVAGEVSAEELEIQSRMADADKGLREARAMVEAYGAHLEQLLPKEAAGLIPSDEIKEARFGLEAAQAKAELALQEIEILKRIK
jgi:hypothetical protein